MSYTVEKINGVTKEYDGAKFTYLFPAATIVALVEPDSIVITYKAPSSSYQNPVTYAFSDLVPDFGATTVEEYCDYLATNGFFFELLETDIKGTLEVSEVNSTSTLLAAGATFTGTAELNEYPDVMITVNTDQNGTLTFEFSPDGTNWDNSLTFDYATDRINPPHILVKGGRYFRAKFENTSTSAQTFLRLQTSYGLFQKPTSPINGTLAETYDAIVTRPTDYKLEVASGKRQGSELWNKFGYNNDVDTGTEILASFGGTFNPLTTATTINIVSTSANDTSGGTGCNSIFLNGIDANRNIQTELVTLNGTTTVTTVSTWLGINRVSMVLCGSGQVNDGDINLTAVTGGSAMAQMPANGGVTQQCIFHVPANYTFNAEWFWVNVLNRAKDAVLTFKFWVYSAVSNGKQEVAKIDVDTSKTTQPSELSPNLPFPISEKTVCWVEVTSDKDNVICNARFSGILNRIV